MLPAMIPNNNNCTKLDAEKKINDDDEIEEKKKLID